MGKTATITTRIEPDLKRDAENVLQRLGVNTTDAITMFLSQVVMQRGLPFDVRIPNKATRAAIAELNAGRGEKQAGNTRDILRQAIVSHPKRAK
jgi:DNA-damage-inducible protein J